MTVLAPNWFTTQYSNRSMHIYQVQGNRLRPMVTMATSFNGSEKAVFWIAGKSKAYKKTRAQRNIPGNSDRKKIEATLYTWTAFETIEEFDLDRMTVDEREVVYQSGAMALGRATDIEIYSIMKAAKTSADVDYSSGAFSAAAALDMCSLLQAQKVPWDGQAYCGLPAKQWNQLLASKQVYEAQAIGGDLPFTKATDTRFWNGVNWFLQVEEDAEDFYRVPSSNKQDIMMWHKSAMGWGNKEEVNTRIVWDNYEDVWTVNMKVKGGAIALQEGRGIVCAKTSSNSSIAFS